MNCPESLDGNHAWTLADVTCDHDGRCKAWICPCGAWRRVTLPDAHEMPAPGPTGTMLSYKRESFRAETFGWDPNLQKHVARDKDGKRTLTSDDGITWTEAREPLDRRKLHQRFYRLKELI